MERCQNEWLQATIKAPTGYIRASSDFDIPSGSKLRLYSNSFHGIFHKIHDDNLDIPV